MTKISVIEEHWRYVYKHRTNIEHAVSGNRTYVTFQSLGYKNRTPFCKKYYSFSFYLKHMVLNALARLYFLLSENHRFSLLLRLTNRTFLSRKAKKSPKMAIFPRQNLTNVFTVGAVFWTGRFSMCKIMFHFYLYNIQTK